MSEQIPLGPGAEFDAVRELLAHWGDRARGIGDDAAIVSVPRGERLIVSVDSAVEDRHFRSYLTPREIGYRAVAAALSDLAAMAALPLGVLIAIDLPLSWRDRLGQIADGIGEAVELAKTRVVGGNLSGSDALSITTTVLGSAFTPLARSTARAGDEIYVTGTLGGSASALMLLEAGESAGAFRDRIARPTPRIAEARWLADAGATAAIDISDGLVADARHVAHASGVSIDLDATLVPTMTGVDVEVALASGEEYELLVTSSRPIDTLAFVSRFHVPLTRIGRVAGGPAGSVQILGARVANVPGHDHFSR